MKTRTCRRCNHVKHITEFTKGKHSKYGRDTLCYECYRVEKVQVNNKHRFGGNRFKVLERDNFRCVKCGMTQEEHSNKYGVSLTVDHIDGLGRYSKKQNHSMENLQTLCLSCHCRKDVKMYHEQKNSPTPKDSKEDGSTNI